MSSLTLNRLSRLSNTASVYVTGINKNKIRDAAMQANEWDHEEHDHMSIPENAKVFTNLGMRKLFLNRDATTSVTKTSVRFAHTDLKVPNFDEYRNSFSADSTKPYKATADERHTYSYISTFGIGLTAAYGAKAIVHQIVANVAPSADVLALAKIEVNLAEIPEGKNVTVKWRSKPLFIKHRTPAEIEKERNVDISTLRDPQTDASRTQKPEWLILLGVCTHLGCVPLPNAGDFKGYFCPCHGSHYDGSGRIRKGPAPLNLEIPPHQFVDENTLVVG